MSYIGDHYFVNPNGYCFVLRDRTLTGDEIIEGRRRRKNIILNGTKLTLMFLVFTHGLLFQLSEIDFLKIIF